MNETSGTLTSVQQALDPYIKPREETARIRRVLATYLNSCLSNESATAPLALKDLACSINPSHEVRGLQREFLKALEANLKARRDFEESRNATNQIPETAESQDEGITDRLGEHLVSVKLQRKLARLREVERYLRQLGEKEAGSPNVLDFWETFSGSDPLPDMPKEVVSGFALEGSTTKGDVKSLKQRLERSVLQAKMSLGREEQLLEEVKARSSYLPDDIGDGAKLNALNATRNELIGWIENELSKATGQEEEDPSRSTAESDPSHANESRIEAQLLEIKSKYSQYIAARKDLIQIAEKRPQPSVKSPVAKEGPEKPSFGARITNHYLLSPYLESLLSASHEQKSSILEKSTLNSILARQLKETGQFLDHLSEESQLLPSFPMSRAARRKSGFEDNIAPGIVLDRSGRVKKWIFAADSSKIATLEAVATKVEEGQVALEGSMSALAELHQLLGKSTAAEGEADPVADEEDIWISEGHGTRDGGEEVRHVSKRNSKAKPPDDIWSALDGNLGMIKQEG